MIHHYNKEAWTRVATEAPDVIVASDGIPIFNLDNKVAPFGIGTYARVLGRYVYKQGSLSLPDAIAKMTLLSAQVLEEYSPAMARKGHIQVGKDADITVFDAKTVTDNATFSDPYQASTGIVHVFVYGRMALS